MPSFSRPRVAQTNAIVGAARRIHINRAGEIERMRVKTTAEWQRIAWLHYDAIGEIKFAFNYFAAIASRCRFFVGYQADDSEEPTPVGDISDVSRSLIAAARYEMRKLSSGRGGQPNLIRALVLNMLVTGEVYLVGQDDAWAAHSTSELRWESEDRVRLVTSRNAGRDMNVYLDPNAFVGRIWRTHPEYSDDSDSSLKGVETECSELILLSRIIRASSQSRLNAGILYVADELRFEKSSDITGANPDPDSDPFEEELTVALTEPIGATDSPSEIVPMIVRGPADFIDKGIKHIDLSRGYDEELTKRHDQTLNRLLNGLDLPKDLVTGVAHVRYANSMTIAEDMLKAHVEPALLVIAEALSTIYLRPKLIARGYNPEEVNRLCVWYDPSEVVTRADRSSDADKGYERMLVSGSAWRRAHGFSDRDAPDTHELITRIALAGVIPPETTVAIMRALDPEMVRQAEKLADNDPSRALLPGGDVVIPKAPGPSAPAPGNELPAPSAGGRPASPIRSNQPAPGGVLPPRDNEDQPNGHTRGTQAPAAAQIIEILQGVTAGGSPKDSTVHERQRRLELALDVERRLRESLAVYLNNVVQRALERAGARVVSKIRGDASLKNYVMDVPLETVFSRIPELKRAAIGLNAADLVRDTLERAHEGYFDTLHATQERGWNILDPNITDILSARQNVDIEMSWAWLSSKLVQLTVERLHSPHSSGPYVNTATVRTAAALAGGSENLSHADPTLVVDSVHSGRAILSSRALAATGWSFTKNHHWVYGVGEDEDRDHFALDGQIFASWEADELRNRRSGTDEMFFVPGDNSSCRCDWLPEVTASRTNGSARNDHQSKEVNGRVS